MFLLTVRPARRVGMTHFSKAIMVVERNLDEVPFATAEQTVGTFETSFENSQIVAACISKFEGLSVDRDNKSTLAYLPTVAAAVQCAVAIQRQWIGPSPRDEYSDCAYCRIGVADRLPGNEDQEVSNDEIGIVYRLVRVAEPGGFCLSRTAHVAIRSQIKLPYDDRANPEHSACLCGELRQKRGKMNLLEMSAVNVGAAAFGNKHKRYIAFGESIAKVKKFLRCTSDLDDGL
jgi:hypothetical protein